MQETHPDETIVDGQIVAYIEEDGEDVALWKNRHDEDGALEDLEAHELERALGAFNRKLRAPKDGRFDDEEEEDEDEEEVEEAAEAAEAAAAAEAAEQEQEQGAGRMGRGGREAKRMRADGGAMRKEVREDEEAEAGDRLHMFM